MNIIIVAEGATERQLKPITSAFVKDVSKDQFKRTQEGHHKLDELLNLRYDPGFKRFYIIKCHV